MEIPRKIKSEELQPSLYHNSSTVYWTKLFSQNPERDFRMEPEAQLSAMLEIRETGLDLTATYHPHPRTPAEASASARSLAAYPDSFHLIVSLANGRPEIRCYRITEQEGCRPATLSIKRAYRGRGTPRCS